MKRLVKLFFATMLCSLTLASCVKPEEIENLQNQINEIKQENIASIESQIKAINSSITKLETTDKELKGYIETLQVQQAELVKADEALTKSIADLRAELLTKISEEKAAILLLLEAYKSEVAGSLSLIHSQIIALQTKDDNLQGQITNLKAYVDTELKNIKDWAKATFATLEQYNSVCTTIAGIQADITSINETIAALQTKTTQDKIELEGKITALDEKTAAALQSAVSQIESTINSVKSELTAAYTEAIAAAITNLESSLKTWVNNQLTGYYTIAQMDAQLLTLEQTMNAKFAAQKEYLEGVINQLSTALTTKIEANADVIAAIQGQLTTMSASLDLLKIQVTQNSADIVQLKADLASAKTSITTAYTAAINTAISTLDGKLSAEIESKVSAVNTALNNAAKDINDKITALTARIKACEDSIAGLQESIDKLLARIQSIVVLPTYSDGSVKIAKIGTTDICFEVTPRSASVALAKAELSVFSLDAIATETKAYVFTNIPVTKVADNGEVLIVTVNGSNLSDDFFAGRQSMSARLKVQDGNNARTSEFFALATALPGPHDYIENGVNLGAGIAVLGDWDEDGTQTTLYWAPVNCGYEATGTVNSNSDHRLGKLYQWGAGDSSLPYYYNGTQVVAREMYYDTATPSPWYGSKVIKGTPLATYDKWNNNQGPCPKGWRLPTSQEFEVLCTGKNGDYGWVSAGTYAGHSNTYAGAEFFGANADKIAGKGVFFPAVGYRDTNGIACNRGLEGYYWPSTSYPGIPEYACILCFRSSYMTPQGSHYRARCFSVRCVSEG